MSNSDTDKKEKEKEKEKKKPSYALPITLGAIGAGSALAGAMLISPKMREAAKNFQDAWKRMNGEGVVDPNKELNNYINDGSQMASGKVLGVIPIPMFMKGVRLSNFTPKQWRYWDSETEGHYKDFAAGPASAYFRFLGEHVGSEKKYDFGKKLIPSFFNPSWWAKRKAEKLPGKGKELLPGSVDKLMENIKGIGKYNVEQTANELKDKFIEYAGVKDLSELSNKEQRKIFPYFDEYLKNSYPDLWKKKYLTDFTQGAIRIPTSVNSYSDLINPVITAQNALVGGGAALMGAGGVWAAVKAYKAKKEEEKRKKEETTKTASARFLASTITKKLMHGGYMFNTQMKDNIGRVVGDLRMELRNASPIPSYIKKETLAKSPLLHSDPPLATIVGSSIDKKIQGAGFGTKMYGKAIRDLFEKWKAGDIGYIEEVTSDPFKTSDKAMGVWEKLRRKGYPVRSGFKYDILQEHQPKYRISMSDLDNFYSTRSKK